MEYAIVNGQRSEPYPHGRGCCQGCGGPVIAKCGELVRWHWAHVPRQACDPWGEPETQWHRDWKARFPAEWREVAACDPDTKEMHIADVRIPDGPVIEFQHSGISEAERRSREHFYKHMFWVIDAKACGKNIMLCEPIPSPQSELTNDVYAALWQRHFQNIMRLPNRTFTLLRSKHIEQKTGYDGVRTTWRENGTLRDSTEETLDDIRPEWRGHRLMLWQRPRRQWLDSVCPIFLDLGSSLLLLLPWNDRENRGYYCVQEWTHEDFVYYAVVGEPPPEQNWAWPETPPPMSD